MVASINFINEECLVYTILLENDVAVEVELNNQQAREISVNERIETSLEDLKEVFIGTVAPIAEYASSINSISNVSNA